jgi:predicted HD phosphohydrolase
MSSADHFEHLERSVVSPSAGETERRYAMTSNARTHLAVRPATSLDHIIALMRSASRYTAGEDLSVLDHCLQTADILRRAFPDDIELQVAGLLHDIDHVIGCHPSMHGDVAADYLAPVVSPPIIKLIQLHVPAKRFLISRDPCYRNRLSAASEATFRSQGQEMISDEVERFRAEPLSRRATALRRADEQAKSGSVRVPPFASWIELLHDPLVSNVDAPAS